MPRLLADLPPYVYGTTRLGHSDVLREQQAGMARTAIDAGLWLHTSRQYDHALEVLWQAFADSPSAIPPLIVKIGGGTAADVRATITENSTPLGIDSIAIGQLSAVDEFAGEMVTCGGILSDLQRIKDEGLVGRFVLEIFALQRRWSDETDIHAEPWTM